MAVWHPREKSAKTLDRMKAGGHLIRTKTVRNKEGCMLRLSKMTDYAVVILATLADAQGAFYNAPTLSERTGLPVPTVQKLLKILTRAGLLSSHRGASGGYSLLRAANEISVRHIIEAIDGPIALTDCVDGGIGHCSVQSLCGRKRPWERVNEAIRIALSGVSLADMHPAPFAFYDPSNQKADGRALHPAQQAAAFVARPQISSP
jgi:FeS assembly SUF system regulator